MSPQEALNVLDQATGHDAFSASRKTHRLIEQALHVLHKLISESGSIKEPNSQPAAQDGSPKSEPKSAKS